MSNLTDVRHVVSEMKYADRRVKPPHYVLLLYRRKIEKVCMCVCVCVCECMYVCIYVPTY
jgi:hypothetical protein